MKQIMVNCWADKLGDCSPKQSKEHLVSKALFKEDKRYEPGVVIPWGFDWCKGKPQRIPISSLASKVLCTKHNSLLSPLDSEATHAFGIFKHLWSIIQNPKLTSSKKDLSSKIDGCLLERWFLKTAINLILAGYTKLEIDKPPIELIELAFGIKQFPENVGLCLAGSSGWQKLESEDDIKCVPIIKNDESIEIVLFEFRGWKFALPLVAAPLPNSLDFINHTLRSYPPIDVFLHDFLKATLVYHIKDIFLNITNYTRAKIHFEWESSVSGKENSYAYPSSWPLKEKTVFYVNPIAIDSSGNIVQCNIEISKDTGKCNVVVPQVFLDRAKYPIRIKGGFYTKRDDALNFYAENEKDPK